MQHHVRQLAPMRCPAAQCAVKFTCAHCCSGPCQTAPHWWDPASSLPGTCGCSTLCPAAQHMPLREDLPVCAGHWHQCSASSAPGKPCCRSNHSGGASQKPVSLLMQDRGSCIHKHQAECRVPLLCCCIVSCQMRRVTAPEMTHLLIKGKAKLFVDLLKGPPPLLKDRDCEHGTGRHRGREGPQGLQIDLLCHPIMHLQAPVPSRTSRTLSAHPKQANAVTGGTVDTQKSASLGTERSQPWRSREAARSRLIRLR